MKILPVEKIREADAYTIEHEPIPSIDLMERAATQLYLWIKNSDYARQPVKIFAGPGNNGGDGLVLGRLLSRVSPRVEVYPIRFTDKTSGDFQINYERLKQTPQVKVVDVYENDTIPEIHEDELVVEAIFGSGLSKPVKGFPGRVIEHINASDVVVIAVDTPSGLFSDKPSTTEKNTIIKADYTLSLQFPKLAFLFPENDQYVGEWQVLPIGLHTGFINRLDVKNYLVEIRDIQPSLKQRNKFQHKGHFGHALLIAGAYGKMGAAVLAAKACLRSGTGLLTAHIPKAGYPIIQTAVPEAMTVIDSSERIFSETGDIASFNAIGVGPGIGMEKQTQNALKLLIQNSSVPLLFDADAINILGENKTWIPFVPKGSIFTPHPKEFERLTEKATNDFERNQLQRDFAVKYGVYVVLKGYYTSVACPDGSCYFNTTGNPGMATGGSGDILTGIILGLMAQGYSPKESAIIGVYLHGLAGDLAAEERGYEALIPSDMVEMLGAGFNLLNSQIPGICESSTEGRKYLKINIFEG